MFDNGKPDTPPTAATADLRIPPGEIVATNQALTRVEAHVAKIAPYWSALTAAQRADLLAHSPVLTRIIALARPFLDEGR